MYALSAAGAPYADAAELNRSIEKNTVCVLIKKLKNAEKAWLIDKYAVKYFELDKLEVWEMYSSEKNETKNKIGVVIKWKNKKYVQWQKNVADAVGRGYLTKNS